jgi:cellulose biosynthesis protein BcsQ
MSIIAVVMQKGGVGKTMTATNVAGALAMRGSSVRLYDANPYQSSSYQWGQLRLDSGVPQNLSVVRAEQNYGRAIEADSTHFDHIVIDCPPNLDMETQVATAAASIILIPCRIGQFDAWSLAQTAHLIRRRKATVPTPVRAVAFVNAVPHYIKSELDEAIDWIKELSDDFDLGPTIIDRAAYRKGAKLGLAAVELPPEYRDGKATDEFETLMSEVLNG